MSEEQKTAACVLVLFAGIAFACNPEAWAAESADGTPWWYDFTTRRSYRAKDDLESAVWRSLRFRCRGGICEHETPERWLDYVAGCYASRRLPR